MKYRLLRIIRKIAPFAFLDPEGAEGIKKRGHRGYVGGMWDEIGQLQFDFLLQRNLQPDHFLLDIACGSLRLGVKAIPYLEQSHYLGVEKEADLVKAGLEEELDKKTREEKQPNIVISDSFEFEKLGRKANFAIAQSLFSHLPPSVINLCFRKLYPCLDDDGVFYATYFIVNEKIQNPKKSHDHGYFAYTKGEMIEFGESNNFTANYTGDWNHPRSQVIVEYRKS